MKKTTQLGMNPSTASNRLVKDTLFRLVIETGHKCYRCGEALTRDSFSLEHKEAWLDSEDPKDRFFDQQNIAFSHISCNVGAARRPNKIYTPEQRLIKNRIRKRVHMRKTYDPQARSERYRTTGH